MMMDDASPYGAVLAKDVLRSLSVPCFIQALVDGLEDDDDDPSSAKRVLFIVKLKKALPKHCAMVPVGTTVFRRRRLATMATGLSIV